ncbi:MAG: tetratricopeptide repeat protein [Gammaproteobacteria bacterium]|nr:tetratricopeptide repeat protein [Gammaproteobacteria bacterium]
MTETPLQLDADELLHFAIRASQNNESEKAILYLKHAIQQDPENAKLHYFLGAQHAEIGMYDRAIKEITKAIELEPTLDMARFQLGLLYATSANIDEAKQAWATFDELDKEHPLYLFKTGLLHLANNEFSDAESNLKKGIELNSFNPDLNADMQRILNELQQQNTVNTNTENNNLDADETEENKASGNHIFLSAYNNDDNDKQH